MLRGKMSRTLHGRGVLRRVREVIGATGGQTASPVPSVPPFLLPSSFQPPSYRHLHLPSFKPHRVSFPFLHSSPPSFPFCSSSPFVPLLPSHLLSAHISTSPLSLKIRSVVDGEDPNKKKKKQFDSPFVTVIDTEDKISKMGLDQAQRLARRRDLKLVRVDDPSLTKGSKDVYRLLTGKQYFEEQIKTKNEKKSTHSSKDEKTITIGGNITEHDLAFKLKSVTKWLNKGHQVKVSITSKRSSKEDMEKVFSIIEEEAKKHKARILQRHEKMDDIRFYIAPPKVKDTASTETAQEDHQAPDEESRSEATK